MIFVQNISSVLGFHIYLVYIDGFNDWVWHGMKVRKRQWVPYTPEQMYALVNDVRAYPEFLPWCAKAEILSESDDELCARLTLQKAGLSRQFATKNHLQAGKMIEVRLLDGPFKRLEGFWSFQNPLGSKEGCDVRFDLDFEFSTPMLALLMGPVFNPVASNLVAAFGRRARDVYGK